ncbi:MAG TPA: zf-HC2 domain-containing protein [Polyangia bacterium]|jgi:anti-sigma factor RsiW
MDHAKASDLFSDYVEGALPPAQKAELEQHLAACIQCRTELESFRQAVGSLGKLKKTAPPSFLPSIQKQIYDRSRGRFFGRRWKLFGRVPFEWVSLAMIIAMLIYYIALMHGAPSGVRPSP